MTLNGVMAVTLRYFTEFGKHAFHTKPPRRSVAECTESIVFCSTCTMSSYRKFTFAISSPDEFLVLTLCASMNDVALSWPNLVQIFILFSRPFESTHVGVRAPLKSADKTLFNRPKNSATHLPIILQFGKEMCYM